MYSRYNEDSLVIQVSEWNTKQPIQCLEILVSLKDKSKVMGDFWHDFWLKLAENDDVGETVIWGL